jgi:hypothetical protein
MVVGLFVHKIDGELGQQERSVSRTHEQPGTAATFHLAQVYFLELIPPATV